MKSLNFYSFLLLKKIKTKIHNTFEKKYHNFKILSDNDVLEFLDRSIKKKIVNTEKGIYYRTKVMNNNKPMTLAQARLLLSYCNSYYLSNSKTEYLNIIKKLSDFILTLKNRNGIFKFNQKKWYLQDEGIATIWVLLSLLETYKITKEQKLLNEIIEIFEKLNKVLFSEINGLMHTLGDDYWCLNASSTYAWFVKELFPYHKNEDILKNYELSINLCNTKFTSENYFPYSEKKPGTYLLLYNPVVIYSLSKAIEISSISDKLKMETQKNLDLAKKYLLKQMDDHAFFVEPEMTQFSRYIISNVTSLVVLNNFIPKDIERKILDNVKSYFIEQEMFLCRSYDGSYFNGNLYEVKDVLMTEVFYWLNIYMSIKN